MKQFIQLIFLLSLICNQTYGAAAAAAAVAVDEEEVKANHAPFYRLRYQQAGRERHLFLLGTDHFLPLSVLPEGILHHIGETTVLLSELGLEFWRRDPIDIIETLLEQTPVTKCLTSNGESFLPHAEGWLSLVEASDRENIKKTLHTYFPYASPDQLNQLYHISPTEIPRYLFHKKMEERHPDYTSRETAMDASIHELFQRDKKRVLAFETYGSRLECFNCHYRSCGYKDSTYGVSLEDSVHKINFYSNEEDVEIINDVLDFNYESLSKKAILFGCDSDDFSEDFYSNYRNAYWIKNTLSQIFDQDGIGLIAVGCLHLDMGCVPGMGKTGLLNFFQALKKNAKTWHGITVQGIDRLNSTKNHWMLDIDISTEGPYLTDLMASL
jgi:hypothetical protein